MVDIIEIDKFYPSSKTCFDCEYVYKDLALSERIWTCPNCGTTHDRDYNASRNIHRVGTSTLNVVSVNPSNQGN